jgi:putative nucleotidyltransferase with HDIG domain
MPPRPRPSDPDAPVRLSEVLAGLSCALDLTEGQPLGHAGRSCVIGMRLADVIGLDGEDRSALFYALLLKDAGCSSNASRIAALFGHDDRRIKRERMVLDRSARLAFARYVARNVRPGEPPLRRVRGVARVLRYARRTVHEVAELRCARGAEVARAIDLPEATAEAIRTLEERWDGSGYPDGLKGEDIPLLARMMAVAQTAEVFVAASGPPAACAVLRARRGRTLDPALVDAIVPLEQDGPFWSLVRDGDWKAAVDALEPPDRVLSAGDERLARVAEAFARVIDAKSPYTLGHSMRVAAVADAIAERLDRRADHRRDLNRAALLHDVGKLGVPNSILDSPRSLTEREWRIVRRHPELTVRILRPIPRLGRVADVAGAHHERLDGSGYHRGVDARALGPDHRILAVADVYEALTAVRPYQAARSPDAALAVIRSQTPHALWADACAALADAVADGRTEVTPPAEPALAVA